MKQATGSMTLGTAAALVGVLCAVISRDAGASYGTFHSQPQWEARAGGPSNVTVFHFDGTTELQGLFANDPNIDPSYSSQGVDFLPFTGTRVFPVIYRNQGHQIPDPDRDGLLTNVSSPNPVADLDGRAIKFDFNLETNAVGVFTNEYLGGDGGFLRAFDSSGELLGEVDLLPGIFGGLITDQPISRAEIVNTYDSDITFGIWDLQFSRTIVVSVPLPERPRELMVRSSPNPSRDEVQIAFSLPVASQVICSIVDISGRCIWSAGERSMEAGSHSLRWSGRTNAGRRVAPGIYFAQVVTDYGVRTAKIVRMD